MKDPYSILGVSKNASKEDIDKAYRRLAKEHHPDRHRDPAEKEKHTVKFKEVNEAYETITNPQKSSGKHYSSVFEDFFSDMFSKSSRSAERIENIEVVCELSLEDLIESKEKKLYFKKRVICKSCDGNGGSKKVCPHCNGRGSKVNQQHFFAFEHSCNFCDGQGELLDNICNQCKGTGFDGEKDDFIDFQVPCGVDNGMRFLFRGKGQDHRSGIGDLFVTIKIKPHKIFSRIDNRGTISCTVPVHYTDLVLGKEIEVPTLRGKEVLVSIPAGTKVNKKFRLKELGLPIFSNRADIYSLGDQLVELELIVPQNISEEHRSLIQRLAEVQNGK